MRYLGIVLVSAFLLSACSSNSSEAGMEDVVVNTDVVADAETKLAVEGMVCSMGCVSAIQNELRSMDGVAFATVNYEESFATVKYDSKLVDEEALIAAIGGIGDNAYSAKPYSEVEDEELIETMEAVEEVGSVLGH